MRKALDSIPEYFKEYLPEEFLKEFGLVDVQTMVRQLHFPDSKELLAIAQERLYFDRLLRIQLHAMMNKQAYQDSIAPLDKAIQTEPNFDLIKDFIASLPFTLTTAQKKVIKENIEALHTGKAMMRLLQGDV